MRESCKLDPSDKLFRWLHPSQFHWEEQRAISAAFKDPSMSVDVEKLTTLDESYSRAQKYGKNAIVSFTVAFAQEEKQSVLHCPQHSLNHDDSQLVCFYNADCKIYAEDYSSDDVQCINKAHACVIGEKKGKVPKRFAKECHVDIYPPTSD